MRQQFSFSLCALCLVSASKLFSRKAVAIAANPLGNPKVFWVYRVTMFHSYQNIHAALETPKILVRIPLV